MPVLLIVCAIVALWSASLFAVIHMRDGRSAGTRIMLVLVLLLLGPLGLMIYLTTASRRVESTMSAWTRSGAIAFGVIGALAGLALGLAANPRTAWFAVFEVGVPSALLGAVLGFASGALTTVIRRRAA